MSLGMKVTDLAINPYKYHSWDTVDMVAGYTFQCMRREMDVCGVVSIGYRPWDCE